jgi:hypothetical protein
MALAVFAIGYGYLCLSTLYLSQSSTISLKQIAVSGTIDRPQMTIYLPEKGTYYLNYSGGELITNESSMLEVFDSKERLVFGLPVFSLPSEFDIDSAGWYSVSLKDVSMRGATLGITESVQNITLHATYWYLITPSKVILVCGAIFSSAVFLGYVFTRSEEEKNRLRQFRDIVKISYVSRFFYGCITVFVGSLAFYAVLTFIFGPLPYPLAGLLIAIAGSTIAAYCLGFHYIVGLILLVFGYGALLSVRKIVVLLLVSLAIAYAVVFLLPLSLMPTLEYDAVAIFVLFVIPLTALLALLMPLLDPLDSVGEARLALGDFLRAFQEDSRKADFRYIKEASRCLSSLIGENCDYVSYEDIERSITLDLFAQARVRSDDGSVPLIRRMIAALNPFNSAAVVEIVGETTDEQNIKIRPRSYKTLELIMSALTIMGAIAEIAYLFLHV